MPTAASGVKVEYFVCFVPTRDKTLVYSLI